MVKHLLGKAAGPPKPAIIPFYLARVLFPYQMLILLKGCNKFLPIILVILYSLYNRFLSFSAIFTSRFPYINDGIFDTGPSVIAGSFMVSDKLTSAGDAAVILLSIAFFAFFVDSPERAYLKTL
jgi:hypothetical protein